MTENNNEKKSISQTTPQQLSKKFSLVILILIIAAFVTITFTVGKPLIEFVSDTEKFRLWVEAQGFWGRIILIGIMCLQVVVAIIPGEVIEIGAGYVFGSIEGMLLCLAGAALGSAIIFIFTKKFGIKMVEAFVSKDKINSLKFVKNSKKLNFLIFILFFIPGTPKDVFTYFVGLTPMKLHTFLIISSIARIPSVISSTIGGNAIGLKDYKFAIIVFVITTIISIIGICIYKLILKNNNKDTVIK